MNKRIFLTLAVTLVAGAILYKMPSRTGGEGASVVPPAQAPEISAIDPYLAPFVARRQAGPPERIKQLIAQKAAEREAEDNEAREDFKKYLKKLTSKKKSATDSEKFAAAKELINYLDKANTRLEKRVRTLESRSKADFKRVRALEGVVPTEY